MVPFKMTFNDINRDLEGMPLFNVEYLSNNTK